MELVSPDYYQGNSKISNNSETVKYSAGGKRAVESLLNSDNTNLQQRGIELNNQLVIDTLNQTLAKRKDVYGCILHSDQGFQYTSNEYKTICLDKGIIISMSSKGSPIDNSPIESWHSLLKKEVLYNNNISSLSEYIILVEEWIEFYNTTRIRLKKK